MDPRAALTELRELAAKDWTGFSSPEEMTPEQRDELHTDHCRMAELVEGLDQWMRRGGFSPWTF